MTPGSLFIIIFTDLDGTLLDRHTYKWEAARPALNQCRKIGIPIILVSSKTRAEIDAIRLRLSLSAPFVSENGGGIFFPDIIDNYPPGTSHRKNGVRRLVLGVPYARLVKGLREIRNELGWHIKGFSDMGIDEIADLTGLDQDTAALAAMREYDEPFVILERKQPDNRALYDAARKRGLTIIEGGRFYHLQGTNDKGMAMERLVSWYRSRYPKVVSIALGDSPNDFTMLEKADFPILVRSQHAFPELCKRLPHLTIAAQEGPEGWNSEVSNLLKKLYRTE